MWYKTYGILSLTILILFSAWMGFGVGNSSGTIAIIVALLLAPILYFTAVKDNQNMKDAVQRAAIGGGLAFVIFMGFFEFLFMEGKNKYRFFLFNALPRLVLQGVVLSSAAAATTVALTSPCQ